jgi:hypothetical protein
LYGLDSHAYPNWTASLKTIIDKSKRKYTVSMQPASLTNLSLVKGDDVVFVYTHGCPSSHWQNPKSKDEWNFPEFSLSTIDDFDYDSIAPSGFKTDYAERRVVLMNIVWDKKATWGGLSEDVQSAWVYAITSSFVKKYWKINDNGYVSLNACHSGQQCAAGMRSMILSLGASVVSGWSDEVETDFSRRSTFFLFDRLLGSNSYNEYKVTPNQRPFPRSDVMTALQQKNLSIDPYKGAQFTFFTNSSGNTFGMLAPTIQRLKVDDLKNELKITGAFGNDQSNTKVKINGQERTIKTFGEKEIIADLKPEDYGDVQVIVSDHPSNAVQLTLWVLHVKYNIKYYSGDLIQEFKMNTYLRGDIHESRTTPEEKPKAELVDLLPSQASNVTYSSSGSHTDEDGTVVTYSGSGKGSSPYDGTYGVKYASAWATFNPDTPTKLQWSMSAAISNATTATSSEGGSESVSLAFIPIEEFCFTDQINTNYLNKAQFGTIRINKDLSMDESYAITAGSIGPILIGDNDAYATLTWDCAPTLSPPAKDGQK